MVLQQCCSCFLAKLVGHSLPPPLVWDPLFSYFHAGFLGDAWLPGHHLLCLEASSNKIRKEGKVTSPQRFIPLSGVGIADWVRNGVLGGQSPPPQHRASSLLRR